MCTVAGSGVKKTNHWVRFFAGIKKNHVEQKHIKEETHTQHPHIDKTLTQNYMYR